MFGQVLIFLFIFLILYYVAMISMDIYKGKLNEDAQNNAVDEEEIDISKDVENFNSTEVKKTPLKPVEEENGENENDAQDNEPEPKSVINEPLETLLATIGQIPEYLRTNSREDKDDDSSDNSSIRQINCTDGIEVDNLIQEVDNLAQKGKSDLGDIIYKCHNAA